MSEPLCARHPKRQSEKNLEFEKIMLALASKWMQSTRMNKMNFRIEILSNVDGSTIATRDMQADSLEDIQAQVTALHFDHPVAIIKI